MTAHFNHLTPAQAEALALIAEEAAEVIMAIGKILRHGLESVNPHEPDGGNNRMDLSREIGDFTAAVRLGIEENVVDPLLIRHGEQQKMLSVGRYLHHMKKPGVLV